MYIFEFCTIVSLRHAYFNSRNCACRGRGHQYVFSTVGNRTYISYIIKIEAAYKIRKVAFEHNITHL